MPEATAPDTSASLPLPLDFEVGEIICFPLLILDRMDWRKANAGGVAVAGMAPNLPRPNSQSIINNLNPLHSLS